MKPMTPAVLARLIVEDLYKADAKQMILGADLCDPDEAAIKNSVYATLKKHWRTIAATSTTTNSK